MKGKKFVRRWECRSGTIDDSEWTRPVGRRKTSVALAIALAIAGVAQSGQAWSQSVQVPAFELPLSQFASPEAAEAARKPVPDGAPKGDLLRSRAWYDTNYALPFIAKQKARYDVQVTPKVIGGVYTEVFTPAGGVAPENKNRVLINLHGGAFFLGARTLGRVESIPIASVGRIEVISVDYRQAPENRFPAASEDVLAVYSALLRTHDPEDIGIYGCSAGGTLTAEAVAMMIQRTLPLPGAIGMLCGTGELWYSGDSGYISGALTGTTPSQHGIERSAYFAGADPASPLVFPMRHPDLLKRFPPSLFISASRAQELSSVLDAHNKLALAGVDTEFYAWDGLGHAFLYDPDLPESRQAYDLIWRFFDKRLGQPRYASDIARFSTEDKGGSTPRCAVVFIGSSSFRRWASLAQDMAPYAVVNRAFGGSTIALQNRYFEEVVAPTRPRAIVFYAGENDLTWNRTPEEVIEEFGRFLALKRERLGQVPLYFVSIKPSTARGAALRQQAQINMAIKKLAAHQTDLHYVDVASPMIETGHLADLFGPDRLHMNQAGYAIWTSVIKPIVAAEYAKTAPCLPTVDQTAVRP